MQREIITVAELLRLGVQLEWFEAVAISQAICDRLRESGDDSREIGLSSEEVGITASGEVALVNRHGARGTALDQVADILRALLPDRDVPTPLRLALSQASLSPSLTEWTMSMAFYERPNRSALIRGVHSKAVAARVHASVGTSRPDWVEQRSEKSAVKRDAFTHGWKMRRHVAPVVAAFFVAAIAAAIVWFIQGRGVQAGPSLDDVTGAGTAATARLQQVVSQLPFVGDRFLPPNVVEAEPVPIGGQWIRLNPAAQALPADRVPAPMTLQVLRSSPRSALSFVSPDAAPLPPALPSHIDLRVYSEADPDVAPPISIYPRFPTVPPPVDEGEYAQFDVLITENGGVESVKVRHVPVNMTEAVRVTLSLSAVKAWRFRPGLKDGEPVRYRKTIWVPKS